MGKQCIVHSTQSLKRPNLQAKGKTLQNRLRWAEEAISLCQCCLQVNGLPLLAPVAASVSQETMKNFSKLQYCQKHFEYTERGI